MKLSISEIINKACELKKKEEKVQWLKSNDNIPVRTVLKFTYDTDRIKFLLPDIPPPWKKNGYTGVEGMLYTETRRLRIFIKGGGYDDMNQVKRESLFISLLEDVDDSDAELLCKMLQQKPLKGLTKEVVMEAFPQDYLIATQENDTQNA
jgi:hypothetical protein